MKHQQREYFFFHNQIKFFAYLVGRQHLIKLIESSRATNKIKISSHTLLLLLLLECFIN
jgi:hypothetical protein